MEYSAEIILSLFLLCDLLLVASSRMMHCIRIIAVQGLLLGLMPFAIRGWGLDDFGHIELDIVTLGNIAVKCIILPLLLIKAMRRANVKRELEPLLGYPASVVIFFLFTAGAFVLGVHLAATGDEVARLAAPVAVSTMCSGLLLIIARRKALTQVIGFLAFENGIAVFGNGLMLDYGLLVELGILLDVFVLVFIMGIAVFHISREFSHIDADQMHALGDATEPTDTATHTA